MAIKYKLICLRSLSNPNQLYFRLRKIDYDIRITTESLLYETVEEALTRGLSLSFATLPVSKIGTKVLQVWDIEDFELFKKDYPELFL